MTRTTLSNLATTVPAFLLLAAIALAAAAVTSVSAASGGDFDLSWQTIDGGGGTSANASHELSGTIGQPDAGLMSGDGFTLVGGFWAGAAGAGDGEPKCPVVGDLNCDSSVGVADLLILLAAWGSCNDCPTTPCLADLNGDCTVGVADLLILLANWG